MQKPPCPIILMIHNPPDETFAPVMKSPIKRRMFERLMKKVTVTQVLMKSFEQRLLDCYPNQDVAVIPNQVPMPPQARDLTQEYKRIIHVAQIAEQYKRQHLLIDAFAKIAKQFPDWTVEFYGRVKKGKHTKYYNRLNQKVAALNLQNQIKFMGYSNNISDVYMHTDINTLPSYSEGFGYGLADGLAIGIPGVGFKSAVAINELIIDGKTGFLVEDTDDYADKLKKLMIDKNLRIEMGMAARKDMDRYSPEKVISAWDQLIKRIVK